MENVSLEDRELTSDEEEAEKSQEKASREKSKKYLRLKNLDAGEYFRVRKDEFTFSYDELADEEDLHARYTDDPKKKAKYEPFGTKRQRNHCTNDDGDETEQSPKGEEPASSSKAPPKGKARGVRTSMIGLNQTLHFQKRSD